MYEIYTGTKKNDTKNVGFKLISLCSDEKKLEIETKFDQDEK